jgi:hypothetical protein
LPPSRPGRRSRLRRRDPPPHGHPLDGTRHCPRAQQR